MEAAAGSAPNRRVRFQRDGDVGVPQFGEALQRRRLPPDRLPLIPFTCDRCDHVRSLLSILLLLLAGVVVLSLGCPELDCWYKQIASYILVTAEGVFFSEG